VLPDLSMIRSSDRYREIIAQLDQMIQTTPSAPLYSKAMASCLGTSVRTLQAASQRVNGMSLHRYLRLKRLSAVRRELITGRTTVKAAAFSNGFWHLGDFSRAYKEAFGELPSETRERISRVRVREPVRAKNR
jgi:AraC family ethanolamine operon transcriptional activator